MQPTATNAELLQNARNVLEQTPRLRLGHLPTPLRELTRFRSYLGLKPRIFLKHDDYTGPGFGGNKVRKLEFVLTDALRQNADAILTVGGERSNHCRITAALCAQLGLECHLILNQPPTPWPAEPASFALDRLYGATIHSVLKPMDRRPAMAALGSTLRDQQGRSPYLIDLGASTPLGALGFVSAIQELISQCKDVGVQPAWIVHSTSSGGTQAGLLAGLRLFEVPDTRVLGISADDSSAQIAALIQQLLRGLESMLQLPDQALSSSVMVEDRFVGEGYGIPSPEAREATAMLARTEGIVLDPVYTAKAFAGMLATMKETALSEAPVIVFWHTGGQMALFHSGF